MKRFFLYLILGLVLFGLPFLAYTSEEYGGQQQTVKDITDKTDHFLNTGTGLN